MSWAHRVVNAAGERTRERERFFFSSPPFFLTLARVHCRVGPTADRQGPANQIAIDALGSAPFQSCHTPSARQARAGWHRREKTDQKRRARARAQREGGAGGGRPFPRKPSSKKNSLLKIPPSLWPPPPPPPHLHRRLPARRRPGCPAGARPHQVPGRVRPHPRRALLRLPPAGGGRPLHRRVRPRQRSVPALRGRHPDAEDDQHEHRPAVP